MLGMNTIGFKSEKMICLSRTVLLESTFQYLGFKNSTYNGQIFFTKPSPLGYYQQISAEHVVYALRLLGPRALLRRNSFVSAYEKVPYVIIY